MSYRRLLLILFVLTNVSTGFSQTLADVARAERARRQGLTKSVTSANTPSANTPSANTAAKPVAREALIGSSWCFGRKAPGGAGCQNIPSVGNQWATAERYLGAGISTDHERGIRRGSFDAGDG